MIFGIYHRSAGAAPVDLAGARKSFTLDGRRDIQEYALNGFVGWTAVHGGASTLPSHRTDDAVALASGHASGGGDLAASLVALADVQAPPAGIDGSFAFALYRAPEHRLVLGNDAFGFHALFVAETDDFVAFCTEYEPLLELPGVDRQLDRDAVAAYYLYGITLRNRTLMKGVSMLPAGTIRTYDAAGARERRHDPLAIPLQQGKTLEEHARAVGDAFIAAVRRAADAFPGAELSLTGGADTRLILSALTPDQRKRHPFVTHYGEKGAEGRDRDVVIAKQLASAAGLRHEAQFIDGGHDEFQPDTFALHRAKGLGERSIAGVLGGEYLGGCCVDVALFPVNQVTRSAVDAKLQRLFDPAFVASLSEHPHDALRAEFGDVHAENKEMMFWVNGFARPFFTQLYFGTAGVRTSTWMVPWQMHQRVVSPFADPQFLRALLAVPFEFLSGYRLYNAIYRSVLPEFTGVPTNSGLAVRSDSVLTMFTGGEEPKKARLDRTKVSRAHGVERLTKGDAAPWSRHVYNRAGVESAMASELAVAEKPTLMTRLKNGYTRSFLFKARHKLPIHGLLMKWKSRSETASAANLESQLAPAFVDLESWCEYARIPRD